MGATLVTALYDLGLREGNSRRRQISEYLAHGEALLGLAENLVVFTEPALVDLIAHRRRDLGLAERTVVVSAPLESLPLDLARISAARVSHPVSNANPNKDTPLYILLTWAKLHLLGRIAAEDPFDASHLAWVDFGIAHVAGDFASRLPELLSRLPDRVRLLLMRPFAAEVLKDEFFDRIHGHVAAGFIPGSRAALRSLTQLFARESEAALSRGRAPSEEQLLPRMALAHPDLFEFSRGDYADLFANFDITRTGTRLCLNMIVKNEAAILERCLSALAPELDYWVICDTGSTDGTQEVVRSFFANRGIPGELHEIPFVDFEESRNRALGLCREAGPFFDYILLADADMELVVEDPAFRSGLNAGAHLVPQRNALTYQNVRLVRRELSAHYVGATHEYLATPEPAQPLAGLLFLDHACGSSRTDKAERDLRLLHGSLDREPGNPRTLFYLAQTYLDSGRAAEAIPYYERRIAAGGWDEEVWYARYRLALCRKAVGDIPGFVAGCLEAYGARPWRAEPLARLARHYRETGNSDACLAICELGERIPLPEGDRLFVEHDAYGAAFAEDTAIAGFYSKLPRRQRRGRAACFALTVERSASESTRYTALRNAVFYARDAADVFGACERKRIEVSSEAGWHAMNPSVAVVQGVRCGIVRTVNYSLVNGRYVIADPNDVISTRNRFVTFDAGWNVVSEREVLDRTGLPREPFPVSGFEDCRLFSWRGCLWCSATVRDLTPGGRCEIALMALDGEYAVIEAHVQRGIRPDRHQKNWVPLVRGDELLFVHMTDPTVVLTVDPSTLQARVAGISRPAISLGAARGGSQALRTEDGWLYLTHDAADFEDGRRHYLHRFILLDESLRVSRASDPFRFFGPGIEFAAGLARDPEDGRLVVSLGIGDEEACLAMLDESAVRAGLSLDATQPVDHASWRSRHERP